MIELRLKHTSSGKQDVWDRLYSVPSRELLDYHFKDFDYKIGDNVHTELTDEFIIELEEERVWAILQND